MSQQYQQYPQQAAPPESAPPESAPPPQAPKRRRWLPWAAGAGAAAGAFVLGVIVGSAGGNSTTPAASTKPQATVTVTTTAPAPVAETTAPPEETTPAYTEPTKTDFKLAIKVLSKQCFGSAGCNVSYRILVTYTGPELDPSKTYDVTYVVRGGEDGPVTNTLSVTGDESSVDSEESVSTKSKDAKLTVVVSDVAS